MRSNFPESNRIVRPSRPIITDPPPGARHKETGRRIACPLACLFRYITAPATADGLVMYRSLLRNVSRKRKRRLVAIRRLRFRLALLVREEVPPAEEVRVFRQWIDRLEPAREDECAGVKEAGVGVGRAAGEMAEPAVRVAAG